MKNSVGYKKPPKRNQFKKGQSGNPKGRPKKDTRIAARLHSELNELIVIRENGKTKKVSKLEALLKRLSQKALDGDAGAIKQIFQLVLSRAGDQAQIDPVIFTIWNRPPPEEN